jgi:hypothetical protein
MANILNVTLNTTVSPPRLDVDDKNGQNKVSRSPNPTTIKWILTGSLAQGSFCPMADSPPAFEWKQPPPDGIFSEPVVGANGNSVSITDTHVDASTDGEWIYALAATLDGVTYTTQFTLLTGTFDNPNIINR